MVNFLFFLFFHVRLVSIVGVSHPPFLANLHRSGSSRTMDLLNSFELSHRDFASNPREVDGLNTDNVYIISSGDILTEEAPFNQGSLKS